jgi:hypothetical protein
MSHPLITLMIPTLANRANYLDRLLTTLYFQINLLNANEDVEILTFVDRGEETTGAKRNWLVNNAKGLYVAGFDDDDFCTDIYIKKLLDAAKSGMDCAELWGLYFINGVYDRPFHHSIVYDHWWQDDKAYRRNPNHISLIKRELILDLPFPEKTVGEDGIFSENLFKSGRLKTEYKIKETLYLYFDRTK